MGKDVGKVERGKGTEPKPAFLPQKLDNYPAPEPGPMGPIGPWATGKVDWNPMAGITGTRPVVDHYSITRYSDGEWRKHNEEVLCCTADDLHRVNMADYNSRRGLESISAVSDKTQEITTNRLKERSSELLRWKTEIEQELSALINEIRFLGMQKRRAIQARNVLGLCRSINGECLTRRGFRDGYDLARDKVEDELIKEAAMISEINMLISNTIRKIDEQQAANKSMKERLEGDWSDRNEAFILTNENISLKNESPTILFRAAAARFPEHQSSEEGWEKHTRELLGLAAAVRGQSAELRALLDGPILQDAMRDLKQQAETVDITLARGVADLEQCIGAMHQELAVVVRRNAESETLIYDLQQGIRGLDKAMKVAQTRLDNYQMRPGVENCRDKSMFSLIDEVKSLGEQSTSMKGQLQEAEEALLNLINSRSTLEKELKNKLKTLDIDRNRCQACRSQYPTATAMSGF
nr:tektin-4 [Halyomorpha halys]